MEEGEGVGADGDEHPGGSARSVPKYSDSLPFVTSTSQTIPAAEHPNSPGFQTVCFAGIPVYALVCDLSIRTQCHGACTEG